MFARVGRFATRYRWPILVVWILAAAVLTIVAPDINKVAVNDTRAFLPEHAPSLSAITTVRRYFPDQVAPSSAVVVMDAGQGNRVDRGAALDFMKSFTTWVTGPQAPEVVSRVTSPVTADPQTAKQIISTDGQAALVLVSFSKTGTEPETTEALDAIGARLSNPPAGVRTYITGDAAILAAYNESAKNSLDRTTWITIILVVAILLLVYRSPVGPLIPLVTIGIAYVISRGIVASLGGSVMTISGYTNIFLIVVLFGAGTDYCLFLISRFREEMAERHDSALAVHETVRTVGETITSSAGTVIVGLSLMGLTELGLYNTSGPSIAIGVAIGLVAGLTFAPALLSLLGDRSFWPRKARHMGESRIWQTWAAIVARRPIVSLIVPVVILVPFAIYSTGLARDFDLLGDLPKDTPARQGFDVLGRHLGPGTMQPLNIVVTGESGYDTPQGLKQLDELQRTLQSRSDIALVRSFTASLTANRTLVVSQQLESNAKGVREGISKLRAAQAAGQDTGSLMQESATGLVDLYSYLQQLASQYPESAATPSFQQSVGAFASLAAATGGAGLVPGLTGAGGGGTGASTPSGASAEISVAPEIMQHLDNLATGLEGLQQYFATTRPDALMLPNVYLKNNAGLRQLKDTYLSKDMNAARYQIVLESGPYSLEAVRAVEDLREVVVKQDPEGVVMGSSAVVADLLDSSNRDMTRMLIFVLTGIFVVLIALLRALVAPVYLILTILLSYAATMGITRLVFSAILGYPGVTWWVPAFTFVMLVALGMDYNIFLMGRVKEEAAKSGNREGTRVAVAKTGGIITSAGIIMAGTFAAMLSASILGLIQIGFAVALGVLIDTFMVRTALVPSIVILFRRWSWWPRKKA